MGALWGTSRNQRWLAVFILAAAVFLPTLGNGLVWDDHSILEQIGALDKPLQAFSEMYRIGSEQTPYYRPNVILTFLFGWRLFGANPVGYHALNIVLHALVSGVVFLIGWKLLPPLPAMLAAAIFAVHPVHVEPVSFISSGPNDLLSALLFLSGVLVLLPKRDTSASGETSEGPRLWLAAGFYFLACLTKEATLLLPALLPIIFWSRPGATISRQLGRVNAIVLPFVVALAGYAVLRWHAVLQNGPAANQEFVHASLGQQLAVVSQVFRLLFFPYKIVPFYDLWTVSRLEAGIGALWLALFGCAVFALGRTRRWDLPCRLGLALFIVTLVPALPVFPRAGALIAERFLYLPSAGFAILAGCAVDLLWRVGGKAVVRKAALGSLCVLLLLMSGWSAARSRDWRDDVTLFSRGLERDPQNSGLYYLLGTEFFFNGKYAEAEFNLRRSIEFHPNFASALFKLGELYRSTGRADAASVMYRSILERNPRNAKAHFGLGSVEMDHGSLEHAEQELTTAVKLDPSYVLASINLGVLYFRKGNFAAAEESWTRGLKNDPANATLLNNLAQLPGSPR